MGSGVEAALTRVRGEPLAHFFAAGLVLFALFALFGPSEGADPATVTVSARQQENLTALFERTWGRPPTPEEQVGLVTDHVRQEILAREAAALGLSDGDRIVRQRLAQKIEFLTDDLAANTEPTDEDLNALLQAAPERYQPDGRMSFRQVFFRVDTQDRSQDIQAVREALDAGADPLDLGDQTALPPEMADASERQVSATFGEAFALALQGLPKGTWHGPVTSPFGSHLVFVSSFEAGAVPGIDDVRDILVRDWRDARRQELRDQFYEEVRSRYEVEIAPLEESGNGS